MTIHSESHCIMDVEDLLQHQRDEDLVRVLQDHPAVQVVMMELVKDSSYHMMIIGKNTPVQLSGGGRKRLKHTSIILTIYR